MAEPSLLCVNCARPPLPHRRTWDRCVRCVELNLPSTYYCGPECMNAHWPKHKVYHKVAKEREQAFSEVLGGELRSTAAAMAEQAERTGSEYHKRFADALVLNTNGDNHAAAKAWRKIIKEWPDRPGGYNNLAIVLTRSGRDVESAPMYLKAMELYEDGTEQWARAAANAFDVLKTNECDEVPKPEWWNDEALRAISARVVSVVPDMTAACSMRARVLLGDVAFRRASSFEGPRNTAEMKEAATWCRRAARSAGDGSNRLQYEELARICDDVCGRLADQEETEAAAARAATDVEAAKAHATAEAKAKAAAEELLAEEEKEKQAAGNKPGKAKGKGKKGKGKR